MDIRNVHKGDTIIQEGDDGNEFFVLDKGEADCFKVLKKGQPETHLKTYYPGEGFGELA